MKTLILLAVVVLAGCATDAATHRSTSLYNYGGRLEPQRPWPQIHEDFARALRDSILAVDALPEGGLRLRATAARAFEQDGRRISDSLESALQQLGRLLRQHGELNATVVGHTDSHGRELYNQAASLQQAELVAQGLMSQGLPFTRVHTEGRGEAEPIADNLSAEGRAANQRVEILIQTAARRR